LQLSCLRNGFKLPVVFYPPDVPPEQNTIP
jgi:hypothetical protein